MRSRLLRSRCRRKLEARLFERRSRRGAYVLTSAKAHTASGTEGAKVGNVGKNTLQITGTSVQSVQNSDAGKEKRTTATAAVNGSDLTLTATCSSPASTGPAATTTAKFTRDRDDAHQEHVSNHPCVVCLPGETRGAGDPATGPDTACVSRICALNEHASPSASAPAESGGGCAMAAPLPLKAAGSGILAAVAALALGRFRPRRRSRSR